MSEYRSLLRILSATVCDTWVDYNGHMGDYAYGIVFSDAATAYMDRIGIDEAYRAETAATLYTLDSRIGFLKECHVGEVLHVDTLVLAADAKRLHLFMRLINAAGDELALCEQVLMHVSRADGKPRSASLPGPSLERLMADLKAHSTMERPAWLSQRIGLSRG
ncbi:acyl-CoA thioester hydrolase [Rhizobium subbaraonis]|uniref:Acyl-CoA thioester hydrolase n=1 Tax=Rhizobium subbaraonis TaxID=908946 RepID=A0A285UVV4_9HYPH|nr:thioesterase family protein [Rhizobium subbaraonis]SOC46024.1 acyl-CoA thioester hydrolase [Rhizobium subbaraonis]